MGSESKLEIRRPPGPIFRPGRIPPPQPMPGQLQQIECEKDAKIRWEWTLTDHVDYVTGYEIVKCLKNYGLTSPPATGSRL